MESGSRASPDLKLSRDVGSDALIDCFINAVVYRDSLTILGGRWLIGMIRSIKHVRITFIFIVILFSYRTFCERRPSGCAFAYITLISGKRFLSNNLLLYVGRTRCIMSLNFALYCMQ
jgi:hypothetical protein